MQMKLVEERGKGRGRNGVFVIAEMNWPFFMRGHRQISEVSCMKITVSLLAPKWGLGPCQRSKGTACTKTLFCFLFKCYFSCQDKFEGQMTVFRKQILQGVWRRKFQKLEQRERPDLFCLMLDMVFMCCNTFLDISVFWGMKWKFRIFHYFVTDDGQFSHNAWHSYFKAVQF